VLKEWRPYSPAARLSWFGIRLAARAGILSLVPRTLQTSLPEDTGSQLHSRMGKANDALPPVILVGNPSVTRKLIVFLAGGGRGPGAVIKLPLTPAARAAIRTEADTLKKLDGRYGSPRLLHFSEQDGAAMQQYLPGRLGSRRFRPDYLRLLVDLARTGEVLSLRSRAHGLRDRLQGSPSYSEHAHSIDAALAQLEEDAALPAVLVHGDFAPWNIRDMRDGSTTLIDWESAEWGGLPLHDLCNFFFMQTQLFSPHTLFFTTLLQEGSWRRYGEELDIPPALIPKLAAAFMLETLARSWEADSTQNAAHCIRQLEALLKQIESPAN
jgi:hypothetical protein